MCCEFRIHLESDSVKNCFKKFAAIAEIFFACYNAVNNLFIKRKKYHIINGAETTGKVGCFEQGTFAI